MITELDLQSTIFDWLQPILNLWMEGRDNDATPRTDGQPVMVWHMQEMPRFKTPILTGRISGIEKIGRDWFSQPTVSGNNITVEQLGNRNFMLYLEYFGFNASNQLMQVINACDDNNSLNILRAGGCTAIKPGSVAEAHTFLGTTPENRALLEIEMRTFADITHTNDVGQSIIEHVKADGHVDMDLSTITLDISTLTVSF